jgi:hypothetical protein
LTTVVLEDADVSVREMSCEALGVMGGKAETKDVLTALINALNDED